MNTAGVVVLVVVLVVATGFGLWRRRTDGRLRPAGTTLTSASTPVSTSAPAGNADSAAAAGSVLPLAELGEPLGEHATLVQFSTVFCQPCRATRRILTEVSELVDGVRYVDIDAEQHLDLVRRLEIRRTPTVFVLDRSGQVVQRASGQPRKADVIAALGDVMP